MAEAVNAQLSTTLNGVKLQTSTDYLEINITNPFKLGTDITSFAGGYQKRNETYYPYISFRVLNPDFWFGEANFTDLVNCTSIGDEVPDIKCTELNYTKNVTKKIHLTLGFDRDITKEYIESWDWHKVNLGEVYNFDADFKCYYGKFTSNGKFNAINSKTNQIDIDVDFNFTGVNINDTVICEDPIFPSLNTSVRGMLVYGEAGVNTPRYRIWDGKNLTGESSLPVMGLINWTVVKAANKEEEFIAVISNASGALLMATYNGTCWGNGTACGKALVVHKPVTATNGLVNATLRAFDVAYENITGRADQIAIIAYSNGSNYPLYRRWNSTSRTLSDVMQINNTYRLGQIGWIDLVEMANNNGDNEIALIMRHEGVDDLSAIIYNVSNSTWGCNNTLSTNLDSANKFKDFGAVYMKNRSQLFVGMSVAATAAITYANKTLNSCDWKVSGSITTVEIATVMDVGTDEIRGNNTCISIQDVGLADNTNVIYLGNGVFSAASANDAGTLASPGAPNQIVACGGFGNGTLAIYVDSTTAIQYYLYKQQTNAWNTVVAYTPTPSITARFNHIMRQFTIDNENSNQTFLFYNTATALNGQLFDADKGAFSNTYSNVFGNVAIETAIASPSTITFDFAFRKFSVLPIPTPPFDPSISQCGNLNTGNVQYDLITNVSSEGTCFNILAANNTLDCHGYTINYSKSVAGVGVNIANNYTTIKSCKIVDSTSSSGAGGMMINDSFATIYNNTISTIGNNNEAILTSYGKSYFMANLSIYNNVMSAKGTGLSPAVTGIKVFKITNSSIYFNNITIVSGTDGISLVNTSSIIIYGNNLSIDFLDSAGTVTQGCITLSRDIQPAYAVNNTIYNNVCLASVDSNGFSLLPNSNNNTFYNNNISSKRNGLYLKLSKGNIFINNTINPCLSSCSSFRHLDIVSTTNATNNILLNNVFKKSNVSIESRNNITVQWYLTINVSNSSQTIVGAEYSINNSFALNLNKSNMQGTPQTIIVTEYTQNGSVVWATNEGCANVRNSINITCFSPLNMSANMTGYTPNATSIEMNRSRIVNLFLGIIASGTTPCDCPASGNFIVSDGSNCVVNGNCLVNGKCIVENGAIRVESGTLTCTKGCSKRMIIGNYFTRSLIGGKLICGRA